MRFRNALLFILPFALACEADPSGPDPGGARATSDRPDALFGSQIHVVYAVPADGPDRGLDTTGVLAGSVGSFQGWLRAQAGGRELRMDVGEDGLDVTFVRLSRSEAAMTSYGPFVRDTIEKEMGRAGLIRSDKVYAVYYDGGSTWACGGAAWPPELPGRVAAMYLRGAPSGISCERPFANSASAFPGYWEFAMLHDLLHTLGIVDRAAPNHTTQAGGPGHVPETNDLMYSGSAHWVIDGTTTLDVGGDDYFGNSVPDSVRRLDASAFLTGEGPVAVPAAASSTRDGGRTVDPGALPFHPPLGALSEEGAR
jgi:hypothetical protein